MEQTFRFKLNGKLVAVEANGNESLLTILRTNLDQTGTKFGCGIGECGSCTVLINNEAVRSCMIYIEDVVNKEIITIEGLSSDGILHPIQQAFVTVDALQCGFCTPGMILNGLGLLLANPNPTREEIIEAMDSNLCRCGSYNRIVEAIQIAAQTMNQKVKL
jgi:carbon-monoxide dehydrogenase small subunit